MAGRITARTVRVTSNTNDNGVQYTTTITQRQKRSYNQYMQSACTYLWKDRLFKLIFTLFVMLNTVFCTRHCFHVHCVFVLYTLLSVLISIEDVYRRLRIPYRRVYKTLIVFGSGLCLCTLVHVVLCIVLYMSSYEVWDIVFMICMILFRLVFIVYIRFVFHDMKHYDLLMWWLLVCLVTCDMSAQITFFRNNDKDIVFAFFSELLCTFIFRFMNTNENIKRVYRSHVVRVQPY